jgi:hypothetical protein
MIIEIVKCLLIKVNKELKEEWTIRQLLKKARLPRAAKAISFKLDG